MDAILAILNNPAYAAAIALALGWVGKYLHQKGVRPGLQAIIAMIVGLVSPPATPPAQPSAPATPPNSPQIGNGLLLSVIRDAIREEISRLLPARAVTMTGVEPSQPAK